jgi:hypothetical protein
MSPEKKAALIAANEVLKKAWPNSNLQICFNLSHKHDNVNYNIKESGIINPKTITLTKGKE